VGASLHHHVALRVADIDRSIRFWQESLDARVAVLPVVRSGGYFDQLFGPGVQVKIAHLVFDAGSIELFEFVEPRRPVPRGSQTEDGQLHFGVVVDDAAAALARVEAAGGRRLMPVSHMGGLEDAPRFCYCTDHEGHVFELLEADHPEVIRIVHRSVPESVPPDWAPEEA